MLDNMIIPGRGEEMFQRKSFSALEERKDFIESHKSNYLSEIDRAEDGLELVQEIEKLCELLDIKNQEITKQEEKNLSLNTITIEQTKILDAYVKKFGKYNIRKGFGYSDGTVELPHPDAYKLMEEIVAQFPIGKKCNITFERSEGGIKILKSRLLNK